LKRGKKIGIRWREDGMRNERGRMMRWDKLMDMRGENEGRI
jgi:hypothetical protein